MSVCPLRRGGEQATKAERSEIFTKAPVSQTYKYGRAGEGPMNDYGLNAAAYTTAGDVLGYYRALDRYAYRAPNMEEAPGLVGVPTQDTERTPIEPIIPANELGTTVPEIDPKTGANIIQNIQSSIKRGVGNLQIVMTTPSHQVIGGRPKAYGTEVRTAIREMLEATGVKFNGVEMPTSSITNLSGFNPQRMNIVEEKRRQDIQEVKDAIRFAADIGGGGGIDIWSQEYSREIWDAPWNKPGPDGKPQFQAYEGEKDYAIKYLVDDRTGQVLQGIQTSQTWYVPKWKIFEKDGVDASGQPVKAGDFMDVEGNRIELDFNDKRIDRQLMKRVPIWDPAKHEFEPEPLDWEKVKERAKTHNDRYNTTWTPEEYAYRTQVENRIAQARGQSLFYSRRYSDELKELQELIKHRDKWKKIEAETPESEHYKLKDDFRRDMTRTGQRFIEPDYMLPSEALERDIEDLKHNLKHIHEASASADAQASQTLEDYWHIKSLGKYAEEKSVSSYAELGIEAWRETKTNPKVSADNPLYVGPEIGWPEAYGGHPEEFIGLIKTSRKKMVELLTTPEFKDEATGKAYKNDYFQPDISPDKAKELASEHIKGMFDTSHMGMWFQHFRKAHPNETEPERLDRFKKWYLDMADKMQKEGVIGGVQAVDTATGAHAHLPPGQGILPVVEAVTNLKKKGFKGFIVSEGHEEEGFGAGRIVTETWRAFGAHAGYNVYNHPVRWSDVSNTHWGYAAPPNYIVGAYAPSNEWKLWSEVPFE